MSRKQTAIQAMAASWLGKRDGGLSPGEEAELAQWLGSDPRHAAAFARLQATLVALDRLDVLRPAGAGPPDADLRLRRPRGKRVWLSFTLAAAAALAAAYVGWWRPADYALSYARTVATETGGLKKIALPEGSVVTLNTDSLVEIRFTAAERRVRLAQGEAHFTVAKDPARPFAVEARGVAVRAVGTAFDVRLRPDSVEVLVNEGRVRVNDIRRGTSLIASPSSAEPPVVAAGERAVISLVPGAGATAPVATAPAEISQRLAWENRRLDFDPTPLRTLAAEFNRYNRHKLVVADEAIAGLKVGGSFRTDDYDTFVRLLESNFGVSAERSEDQTILRGAAMGRKSGPR